jgi:hypothetical protein
MNLLGFEAHPGVDDSGDVFLASHKQVFKLSMSTGLLSVFAGDGVAGDQGHGDGGGLSVASPIGTDKSTIFIDSPFFHGLIISTRFHQRQRTAIVASIRLTNSL